MKEIKKLCDVLKEIFGVQQWELDIQRLHSSGGADVMVEHRYRRFRIRIFDDFFRESREWQADAMIHEFCHLFNVPMYNLLEESRKGKLITDEHGDDILEQCNTRAEKVIVSLLDPKVNATLRKARLEYIGHKKKRRSRKRSPKLPQKK